MAFLLLRVRARGNNDGYGGDLGRQWDITDILKAIYHSFSHPGAPPLISFLHCTKPPFFLNGTSNPGPQTGRKTRSYHHPYVPPP